MRLPNLKLKPIGSALIVATLLSACGGGGGSGPNIVGGGGTIPPGDTQTEVPLPKPVSASMSMSCVDGPNYQCSGDTIIRTDNGLALTSSGVQIYGKSTNDMETTATGFALATGGIAEIRLSKDSAGAVSKPALLLRNLGLSWDGINERPPIIDDFNPTLGRTALDESGKIVNLMLPDTTDLTFYDVATKGAAGTQANYANNRYFPRSYPSRCDPVPTPPAECRTTETSGIQRAAGDWSNGGTRPDLISVGRLHGDGDVHAGDAVGGGPLPEGTGKGVPFPGSKGYRSLDNWSLRYSNLGVWETQDTVQIHQWGASGEHNKNRRGIVAFGDVTDPAAVPASGSATYSGIAYGWYVANSAGDPDVFWGAATLTVNFATRETVVTIGNTNNNAGIAVPAASFTANTKTGAAGQSVANYLTGPVDNGTLKGGVSGRYFGPVNGAGPAEVAGAFSLSQSATGRAVIGGFIARRQ
jgi:hypothetical protein